MSCGHTVFPYGCGLVEVSVFLEPLGQCSLGFPYVGVAGVLVAGDVIDYPTLFFLWGFILRVDQVGSYGVCWFVVYGHIVCFEYSA